VPQVLKVTVRARIRAAALSAFAEHGYRGTTMADVARRAGVATANLYRYYADKNDLFDAVIGDPFVAAFEDVVGRRVRSFGSLLNADDVAGDVADEMMDFWVANRLEAAVVLARADGTRHADVRRRLGELSVEALVEALPPGAVGDGERVLLRSIFDNTARTIAAILLHTEAEATIRSTIASFWHYQLAGLAALLRHLAERRGREVTGSAATRAATAPIRPTGGSAPDRG
jgi:AcrR family transcriptional regulator